MEFKRGGIMFKNSAIIIGLVILILATAAPAVKAVALSDKVRQQMIDDGTLDDYIEQLREMRAKGMDQPLERPASNFALGSEAVIHQRVLVLLIDFPDKPDSAGYAWAKAEDFDSLLFSDSLNPTGSMKNFYYENSYGNYIIDGDVYGWYRASQGYSYYANNAQALVLEAIEKADADVDYSKYKLNGPGYVAVIVVHAGTGHEESGNSSEIHSHMAGISETRDGVNISVYTIQPEESASSQSMSAIGVFCHEWGHVLFMPDLYDTDYSSQGVGHWSLMASGNYNGDSRTPAHFDAWCKYKLGWLFPMNVSANMLDAHLPAVEYDPVVYRLARDASIGVSQYFLIENRYLSGFDAQLPGGGLLIYHIDESIGTNNNEWHPKVFVEQADGRFDLQSPYNRGDGGDPWPYDDKHDFHDKTTPNSVLYAGISSRVGVWNISGRDSIITADLEVSYTRPWIEMNGISLHDTYGDNNGIPEAGEKIQLVLSLINDWAEASDFSINMTCNDPALDIEIASSGFPPIAMGGIASNIDSPFEFQIPETYDSRIDSFFFDITANGGEYHIQLAAEANVGRPQILIVDDDNGDPSQLQDYLKTPLYLERTPYDIWDKSHQGSPTAFDLTPYHVVMWLTGDAREYILSVDDREALRIYLDYKGNLFLTGQGLAKELQMYDQPFLNDYLKAGFIRDTTLIPFLNSGDGPVSTGMKGVKIYGTSGANNQTVTNIVEPVNGGVAEWAYPVGTGEYCAVSYNGEYKTVFFAFGFEAITSNDTRYETQASVLARVLEFFGDLPTDVADHSSTPGGLPIRFDLDQNYPNPFNPATTISYFITGTGPRVDRTRLVVFNILGQHVRTLVDRDEVPGRYSVSWDGLDDRGREAASGLYFYRMTRGSQDEVKKMILLK